MSMLRSLDNAKSGMDAGQFMLDVITNNLANVNTTGFKGSRAVFQDLLYQTVNQAGAQSSSNSQLPTGLSVGSGSEAVSTERLMTQGNQTQTGNPYDLAISGDGFFQILMPDGTTAYTRDGTFSLNSQGQLVTQSGYQVIPQITVPQTAISVTISPTGIVDANFPGQVVPQQIGQLQLVNFINEPGLAALGGNLFQETAASGSANAGNPGTNNLGTLNQSWLEASNVDTTTELVDMITAQRSYEINSKGVKASDEMLQDLTQL